jgi:hypothetical protein
MDVWKAHFKTLLRIHRHELIPREFTSNVGEIYQILLCWLCFLMWVYCIKPFAKNASEILKNFKIKLFERD